MSKIQMQCRRGMLELDVILQRFLEHDYRQLPNEHKTAFSALLNQEDPTLYDWLINDIACTDAALQPIVETIKKNMSCKKR